MTAERESVYKSRPAVSLERAQEVAQKFMEDVRSKRNLREKRLDMIQKQKEDKDTGKADWWMDNDEWQMFVCLLFISHSNGHISHTWTDVRQMEEYHVVFLFQTISLWSVSKACHEQALWTYRWCEHECWFQHVSSWFKSLLVLLWSMLSFVVHPFKQWDDATNL